VYDHPIHQLIRRPCVLNHQDAAPADEYGDPPLAVLTSTDERCYVTQSRRAEEDAVEVERWQVYLLPSVSVDANDTVEVDGMVLELYGNPWVVHDPVTGWATHIEASAMRRR
jgi:hypothetical protein